MDDGTNQGFKKVPWGAVGGRAPRGGVGWEWRAAQETEACKPVLSWSRIDFRGEGSLLRQASCDERNPCYPRDPAPPEHVCPSPGSVRLWDFSSCLFPHNLFHLHCPCSLPPEVEICQGFENFRENDFDTQIALFSTANVLFPGNKAYSHLLSLSFQMSLEEEGDLAEGWIWFWQQPPKTMVSLTVQTVGVSSVSEPTCICGREWVRVWVWVWVCVCVKGEKESLVE